MRRQAKELQYLDTMWMIRSAFGIVEFDDEWKGNFHRGEAGESKEQLLCHRTLLL